MTPSPALSISQMETQQQHEARKRANAVRSEKAAIRNLLRMEPNRLAAERRLAQIIELDPPCIRTATVYSMVTACRMHGPRSAKALLRDVRLSATIEVGKLIPAQRIRLIRYLLRETR